LLVGLPVAREARALHVRNGGAIYSNSGIRAEFSGDRQIVALASYTHETKVAVLESRSNDSNLLYGEESKMLTIGQFRGARGALGLTQIAFAKLLKMSPASVARWESGRMDAPLRTRTDVLLAVEARLRKAGVSCSADNADLIIRLHGNVLVMQAKATRPTRSQGSPRAQRGGRAR